MKIIKYKQSALLSLIILFLGYILIRYLFFDLHGMKDWPTVLFVSCFAILIVHFFIKAKFAPLIVSVFYSVGFVIGLIFQTDGVDAGGGATNNLWLIWTTVILVSFFISIIIELLVTKKSDKQPVS